MTKLAGQSGADGHPPHRGAELHGDRARFPGEVEGQLGQLVDCALGGDLGDPDRAGAWPGGRGLGHGVELLRTHQTDGSAARRAGLRRK
jgi:hypothetical protein